LREPNLDSFTSVAGTDDSEQVMVTSAPTSQDTDHFKKLKLPLKATLQKEVEQLDNKHAQEREQYDR
jgi:hypothetical protein